MNQHLAVSNLGFFTDGGSFCATVARQTTSSPTCTSSGKCSPSLYCHLVLYHFSSSSSFSFFSFSTHFTCDQHLQCRRHAQQPFLEVCPLLFLPSCCFCCTEIVVFVCWIQKSEAVKNNLHEYMLKKRNNKATY